MAAASLKQTRVTILFSLNAAATLIAGVLIAGAILLKDGMDFKVVGERSDEIAESAEETELIDAEGGSEATLTESQQQYVASMHPTMSVDSAPVAIGELWNEGSITIYETANYDICVGGGLSGLGDMYWQTSNPEVISGFYSSARTWLGYSSETCRFPIIAGTGTTTITAGTYDGARRDSITVTVVEAPQTKWKYEVLSLVNQERVRNGLGLLTWGDTCADAAETRAQELVQLYSHMRPDGQPWSTACDNPDQNALSIEGENLVVGNSAVSPETAVAAWMNSEKHRENILNPDYTKLSVGFHFDVNTKYRTYWSQYFSNY